MPNQKTGKLTASSYLLRIVCSVILLLTVNAAFAQTIDFSITQKEGCAPMPVNFTDNSTGGGGVVWREWYLGKPIIGLQTGDPVVGANYDQHGTYSITLKVRYANGVEQTKTETITVHPAPVADFETADTVGCAPLTVRFKDKSSTATGSITEWAWDLDVTASTAKDPVQTYNTTGNYNIILFVKNNWGCKSPSVTRNNYIRVVPKPDVRFTLSPASTCKDTMTVFFTNTSVNATGYEWEFGDNATSTDANTSHFYNIAGIYTVKLRSLVSPGCGDSSTLTVRLGRPSAQITSAPDTVCENAASDYKGTVSAGASGRWVFGNQSRSGAFVSYAFPAAGEYDALFIATNPWGCSDTAIHKIVVKPGPKPDFSIDTSISCSVPFNVQLTDQSNGSSLEYTWNFGDGNTFTGPNPPLHAYTNYNSFSPSLTVRDLAAGCSATISKPNAIRIIRPSVILYSVNSVCEPPKPVDFRATISNFIGAPLSYQWDFGDGATNTTTTPEDTHIYTGIGTFTVTLTVTSPGGCTAQTTRTIVVNEKCPPPPPLPPPPDTVIIVQGSCAMCNQFSFRDTVVNSTVTGWDFGDGTVITGAGVTNPITHVFPLSSKDYTVTVTRANNISGAISTTKVTVNLICLDPQAVAAKTVTCLNEYIDFSVQGVDSSLVAWYRWDFGEGSSVILNNNNPTRYINGKHAYAYSRLGTFQVTLTIADRKGCTRTANPISILVQGPMPDFTAVQRTSCDNTFKALFEENTTLNAGIPIVKWQWNFGDGSSVYETTADTVIPKLYTNNVSPVKNYTVTLNVTDAIGCAGTVTKTAFIKLYKPAANFSSRDTLKCKQYTSAFTNLSNAANATYTWHYGDGTSTTGFSPSHTFPGDGAYDIMLAVCDENGCTDTAAKNSYVRFVQPMARIALKNDNTCPPINIGFADSSLYGNTVKWDFGDGRTSTEKSNLKTFTKAGQYNIVLSIVGLNGCRDTAYETLRIRGATAELQVPDLAGCRPYTAGMKLVDRSNIDRYAWDFGDGTPVIARPQDSVVSHRFPVAGKYVPNVILYSTDGCVDFRRSKDTILVDSVDALFRVDKQYICESGRVQLTNLSKAPSFSGISSYQWDLGNGQTSTQPTPGPLTFTQPGMYGLQLSVTSKYGCTDQYRLQDSVRVYAKPQLSIQGNHTICEKDSLRLTGLIQSTDSVSSATWLYNGVAAGHGTGISLPGHTAGSHQLSLHVITRAGCDVITSMPVTVHPIPHPAAAPDTTICTGGVFRLRTYDGVQFQWQPANGLTDLAAASPVVKPPPGLTVYRVTAKNTLGCSNTDSVLIKVDDSIRVHTITPIELCQGSNIQIMAAGNAPAYQWTPATSLSSGNLLNPVASPTQTTNYTLVGISNNRCPNDTGYVRVIVNPTPDIKLVTAFPSTFIIAGQPIRLDAEATNTTRYSWSPAYKLQNANTRVATWREPDTTTTFTVMASNDFGCVDSASIELTVDCDNTTIRVPNSFTPNGDGLNDHFRPLARFKNNPHVESFQVFNRWGQIVYKKENVNVSDIAGWDGTVNGVPQPAATYVWQVAVKCGSGIVYKKDFVILIR